MKKEDNRDTLVETSEFSNILKKIDNQLGYTNITEDIIEELNKVCTPCTQIMASRAKLNPTYFAYHILGIRPYTYQYMLFEAVRQLKKRIFMISSRQMGKSTALAFLALWASYYNMFPSGLHNNTKIIIVSKSDGQAKKIIKEIKSMIVDGDQHFSKLTNGRINNIISNELALDQPQNVTQISWTNNCFIKALAPTSSSLGESADVLILDEASRIPEDLFYEVFEPMTSATRGIIIMASTPYGQSGLGYKIFDPMNERAENAYYRLWIPWWYCEDKVKKQEIEKQKEQWIKEGKLRFFQQEYEAKFTVSESNFFDSSKVDAAVDDTLSHELEEKHERCSLGIDYGYTSSNTVITIVSDGKDGILRERYQRVYDNYDDLDLVDDILELHKRYNIIYRVGDDCPAGFNTSQKLIKLGYPMILFNFRSDQASGERNRGYYLLRSAMNAGKVKITKNERMIKEMKMLLEIHKSVNVSITPPAGEKKDCVDSLTMASYPFLSKGQDEEDLACDMTLKPGEINENYKIIENPREDKQWKELKGL